MGAIFTFLVLICAFLTIPFLVSSEESHVTAAPQVSQPSPPPQTPPFQLNQTFNFNQTNNPSSSGSTMPAASNPNNTTPSAQDAIPNNNAHPLQQALTGNAPAINQPLPPAPTASPPGEGKGGSQVDEEKLLDGLIACRPSVLGAIANCIHLPAAWHPSDKADPAEQATNLMNWAKHPNGPGIGELNRCYFKHALGIEIGTETGKKNEAVVPGRPIVNPAQPPVLILVKPRPVISDNPSARELLDLAGWLLTEVQLLAQEVAKLFDHTGTISRTRFKPAIDCIDTARQHVGELLNKWLPQMRSLPAEEGLSKVHTYYWEIVNKITVIMTGADVLISLLEQRQTSYRQEITKQSNDLITKCSEIIPFFSNH